MSILTRRYRAFRARQRARVKRAGQVATRVLLVVVACGWLIHTWPRETLTVIVCASFGTAIGAQTIRMRDRAPARTVGESFTPPAHWRDDDDADVEPFGPANTQTGDVVYDDRSKRQYAYTMGGFSWWNRDHMEWVKIGHSNAPALRVGQIQAEHPDVQVRLLSFGDGGEPLERHLHDVHDRYRLDRSELFVPNAAVLQVIVDLAEGPGGQMQAAGQWVVDNYDFDEYRDIARI